MLSAWENIAFIVLGTTFALGCFVGLRAIWPARLRREHNDLVGWQVSVLGTTYAVVVGFMLWNVWNNFQLAEMNAQAEADSLANIYRLAQGLPATQAAEVKRLAREYVNAVIDEEWPAMHQQTFSSTGQRIIEQLWATLIQPPAHDAPQPVCLSQTLSELTVMTHHRRIRELQSRSKLPTILWTILIVGGCLTVGGSSLFGSDNFKLHFILVFSLSLMISLILVAIADIDRPFLGSIHVEPDAFRLARETFKH